MTDEAASIFRDLLTSTTRETRDGEPLGLTDALYEGLGKVAYALRQLGVGDAATPMGALEALAVELRASSQSIADGLHAIAEAINNHG
jgi:hypothetical protein